MSCKISISLSVKPALSTISSYSGSTALIVIVLPTGDWDAIASQSPAGKTINIKAVDPEYEEIVDKAGLTDREVEILQLIVQGSSNAQISDALYVTVGTIKTHIRHILNKLCVDDRTHAAVLALRAGIIE